MGRCSGAAPGEPYPPDTCNHNYRLSGLQAEPDVELLLKRWPGQRGDTVGLSNVWIQTRADGLVRADQVTGIDAHQTPALTGKPSRWLLDVILAMPIGSGGREAWTVTALHRTLVQTSQEPVGASLALARLLAQLDLISAAGVISVSQDRRDRPAAESTASSGPVEASTATHEVRFTFVPFSSPAPGHHTGAEYL